MSEARMRLPTLAASSTAYPHPSNKDGIEHADRLPHQVEHVIPRHRAQVVDLLVQMTLGDVLHQLRKLVRVAVLERAAGEHDVRPDPALPDQMQRLEQPAMVLVQPELAWEIEESRRQTCTCRDRTGSRA